MPEISGRHIPPAIDQLGQEATNNINNKAQPRFNGNERVPIEVGVSPEALVNNLQRQAAKGGDLGREAKQMLGYLGNENRGWTVTAGMHQGGIGGAAGGADPNHHVTTSTGHHIQFNDSMEMKKITGPGFDPPGPARVQPSNTQQELNRLKNDHGLNDKQALQVHTRDRGNENEQQAVDRVRTGAPSRANDYVGRRGR